MSVVIGEKEISNKTLRVMIISLKFFMKEF